MKNKVKNSGTSVKSGELLLTEEPFAFVLSSKEKGIRCDNCLEKVKVLKCSGCQFVHYCGRTCQKEAWIDHKWECSNLKRIAPKVIPDAGRMLAKIIHRMSKRDGHTFKSYFTSTSFRMWKDLMSHYSDLKSDMKRMDHFTSLCGVLYEFLKDTSLPNTVELMGIYGRMVINSFTILDVEMNSIGTGIYLGCSIIDHSCSPNAVATFDGKTISIRALYDMPSLDWNQIRISYIDLMKTPYERQTELLTSYYFLCQCDKCLDEKQVKVVHAAKCINTKCENPVQIPWKANCELVRKANKTEKQNGHENQNGGNIIKQNGDVGFKNNDKLIETKQNGYHFVDDNNEEIIHCSKCGTKCTEEHIEKFKNCMEFTEMHLHEMKGASVAYVDVCKYCLEKQDGVLHPFNVMHAQTLDHAFDALIQVQLWDQACVYAESLLQCFRFYYGDCHPLLGLLHLKYGKILLYKMNVQKAFEQLKCSESILKITHGERHPLYKEELLPLLRQSIIEQQ